MCVCARFQKRRREGEGFGREIFGERNLLERERESSLIGLPCCASTAVTIAHKIKANQKRTHIALCFDEANAFFFSF